MPNPGNNQQIILATLAEQEDLTLAELQRKCVPARMNLQGLDSAIGSLLRKNKIHIKPKGKIKAQALPSTDQLSQTEHYILSLVAEHSEPLERLVITTSRSLKMHEKSVRSRISQLKKRGLIEVLNIPKRGVYITQTGLDALGEEHVV